MAYEIVVAGMHHLDELVPLFDAYRVYYQQESDLPGAARFLQRRLAKEESRIFAAISPDLKAMLGFVQLYPIFSSVSMQRLWLLNDLFVKPEFRRKGVGKALMEASRQFAVQTGAKGLMLETGVENEAAQKLYEQLGYERSVDYYVYNLKV
jgi:ribosomal protein S18 acetylase RimI-like enzyme